MRIILYLVAFCFFLGSCARPFHALEPSEITYRYKSMMTDSVCVYYKFNIQSENKNKPYARKENKKDIKLIALKIENSGNDTIRLRKENLKLSTIRGKEVEIIDLNKYTAKIRQCSEQFLLFYSLAGIGIKYGSENGERYTNVTYNPIPLGIGIVNAIYAESSNGMQKENLETHNIFGKSVLPHTTIYGLIAIKDDTFSELNFEYIP